MLEQHLLGRDRRIGLQLEHPMTVAALTVDQGLRCGGDWSCSSVGRSTGGNGRAGKRFVHLGRCAFHDCMTKSAARVPERTALSIVAGRPVSVQSPASARLRHAVLTPGRLAFLRRRCRKGRAPLAHDLPWRHVVRNVATRRTSRQIILASSSLVCA